MSYQVLARKWRPGDFSEVVGQEHVVRVLCNSLDQNKIHQAYLLSGSRGEGKTTIGRIITKCLNCEISLDSKPCNNCKNCEAIGLGNFGLRPCDNGDNHKTKDGAYRQQSNSHYPLTMILLAASHGNGLIGRPERRNSR